MAQDWTGTPSTGHNHRWIPNFAMKKTKAIPDQTGDFSRTEHAASTQSLPEFCVNWIRFDTNEKFSTSASSTQPLRRGWLYHVRLFKTEIGKVLDYLYPAAFANWEWWKKNALSTTSWSETAERQTGRFRIVHEIDEAAIQELVGQVCQSGLPETKTLGTRGPVR